MMDDKDISSMVRERVLELQQLVQVMEDAAQEMNTSWRCYGALPCGCLDMQPSYSCVRELPYRIVTQPSNKQ